MFIEDYVLPSLAERLALAAEFGRACSLADSVSEMPDLDMEEMIHELESMMGSDEDKEQGMVGQLLRPEAGFTSQIP